MPVQLVVDVALDPAAVVERERAGDRERSGAGDREVGARPLSSPPPSIVACTAAVER